MNKGNLLLLLWLKLNFKLKYHKKSNYKIKG